MNKILRCAIYTRKSTEDGLEQEFNSLHAQREACEAYARSQSGEGWRVIKHPYNDGGFSGGNMKRPGLETLMTDIDQGRVDLVLVYKIDRLTRSLSDFARIVDLFDTKRVSFVSVTQQFNTATSMGRLTLNMLLSFAQFEREVTGERIRDKVAASKKKGMWMGGNVPIGYTNKDKKLVINKNKASIISDIFTKYLELGSVRYLKAYCDCKGYGTNPRKAPNTLRPFSRGHLYKILNNSIYKGMISYKGEEYKGQHKAIVSPNTFNKVQEKLAGNTVKRKSSTSQPIGSLLTSKIRDETGDRLLSIYTVKSGKRYRYYISSQSQQGEKHSIIGWRLPAKVLEDAVKLSLLGYIKQKDSLLKDLANTDISSDELVKAQKKIQDWSEAQIIQHTRGLIDRVTIAPGEMTIALNQQVIKRELGITLPHIMEPLSTIQPFTHKKRGVEQRLILGNLKQTNVDHALFTRLKDAQAWINGLSDGSYKTVKDISEKTGLKSTDVSRYLLLAFLAPDIKEAIIDGTQPPSLTLERLKKIRPLPACWKEQREVLGF